MACNCGGANGTKQKYLYTTADGHQITYTSEVQAQAAKIREQAQTGRAGTYQAVPA